LAARDPELVLAAQRAYSTIVLCAPDFPFVQDGTRRDDAFRQHQHAWYEAQSTARYVRYVSARGAGARYGDFQFATDPANANFLRAGILSGYLPTGDIKPIRAGQRRVSQADWNRLIDLAHKDKTRAFDEFADFYLASSGQRYWSDTHQLNLYSESYRSGGRLLPVASPAAPGERSAH
jgi:hypothetical protein